MDIKSDILSRAYISLILIVIVGLYILASAAVIQQKHGKYWRSLNDSLHIKTEEIAAERGTIYSEDGKMLSTSIPFFDIYIDFGADGLRDKKGKKFYDNLDSLSYCLSNLFKDYSQVEYSKILAREYKQKNRYFLLHKDATYVDFKMLKTFPIVRLGRNASGFIAEVKNKRLNPYGMLAYRTIGLDRAIGKVGLELKYDSILKGTSGTRTVRYIAGGVAVPVEDAIETETQNGKDIITTIDVLTQEITENALKKMMLDKKAQMGCAIVMETKTGKIKALANLGANSTYDAYYEDNNYALFASEPGSTLKLASLLTFLDDKKVNLNTPVEVGNGEWQISPTRKISDAHTPSKGVLSVQECFESSSNVGMSKIFWANYKQNPKLFFDKLRTLRLDSLTGIDLIEDTRLAFPSSKSIRAYNTDLASVSYGYAISISPLQSITLYNAVANNGKMMRPYLVSAIQDNGITVKEIQPTVLNSKICSDETIVAAQTCLKGVCSGSIGSAREVFKDCDYKVAGKTGTNHIGYNVDRNEEGVYQSSFIGYFPADNPQYTIAVVIKNTANQAQYYGGQVAAPVFKEIADRLYTTYVKNAAIQNQFIKADSSSIKYSGFRDDIKYVLNKVGTKYNENVGLADEWVTVVGNTKQLSISAKKTLKQTMPLLTGMNMKDAVCLCENLGLKVTANGKGKVNSQSISEGTKIAFGQTVNINLN